MEPVSLVELARLASLMTAVYAAGGGLVLLLAPAEVWAWPHPVAAVRSALESVAGWARPVLWDITRAEAAYPLWRAWDNAPFVARRAVRDAALTAPALLILLCTSPKGELA